MLLEHMHHWSRNLLRFFVAARTCRRFGAELDWEKLWRDQVFGAKMTETNGKKLLFFRGSVWHPKCDHGRLVLDQN